MLEINVKTLISVLELGDAAAQALATMGETDLVKLMNSNPGLRDYVLERCDDLIGDLESLRNDLRGVPPDTTLTADLETKIHEWFKSHPGKHAMSAVRIDLGVPEGSKPFKTAVQNLIANGSIRFNEKRGKGAEYWLPGK